MTEALKQLHIGGGDVANDLIRDGSLEGRVLIWADYLHAGPVPAGLSLEEMSRMRARFVSSYLEGRSFEDVLARLNARDSLLKGFKSFDEVTLWMGKGLDDQLRLLQLLTWFAQRELGKTRLSLVWLDESDSSAAGSVHAGRREVLPEELTLAKRAWDAFCSDTPLALSELAHEDLSLLPFLGPALLRQLEQFPWTRDGLSRTEQQILQAVADGPASLRQIYQASQVEREERPFMAEAPFLHNLRAICGGKSNLIEVVGRSPLSDEDGPPYEDMIWERELQLTDIGRKILMGQADCVRLYGIDRWLGGVRLHGAHAAWRWDGRRQVIVALSG
jgi:hypothetical protein